ncbi:MAG: HDIG domain-containing protein [Calothrix sp. C42_A2020_038]|nr:HDIG domain-containing protein [Calothrix sp. C42_A2020_038]
MRQAPFLQSLTQRLTCCRRWYKKLRQNCSFQAFGELYISQPYLQTMARVVIKNSRFYTLKLKKILRKTPILFAIALISLTCVIGHSWYSQPQIKVGSITSEQFLAPSSKIIENKYATQEQRQKAISNLVPVLTVDKSINQKVTQKLETILTQVNDIRDITGSFPYYDTFALSISTQRYLRSASNNDWEAFQLNVANRQKQSQFFLQTRNQKSSLVKTNQSNSRNITNNKAREKSYKQEFLATGASKQQTLLGSSDLNRSGALVQALAEVETYRLTTSDQSISALTERLTQVRQAYIQAKDRISELISQNSRAKEYGYEKLVDLTDDEWRKTQTLIEQTAARILTQGISPGLAPNILREAINLNIQSSSLPKEAEVFANTVLLEFLQANLKIDEAKMQAKTKLAADEVKPVMVEFKQGSVIVNKNEKITDWHFLVLETYGLIDREVNWLALSVLATAITGAILIFIKVDKHVEYLKRARDYILILLLTLSTPLVLTMGTHYTTWSTVSMLLGSFYGTRISITVIGLLLVFLPLNFSSISTIALLAGAVGGFLGSCMAQKRRSREELGLLGIAIAVTQGSVYLVLKILLEGAFNGKLYSIFIDSLLFTCSGLCWSVVALGLSSYLEQLFDLVTPIRLAELANPNRPLLKSLAAKTPGTFQHTLFVASLAEAAASQLGCNVELVRAGTLYHDIGKMHDPKAFIENQMGGPNKHDTEINDPWLSAAIIKKHVSEGLVIARKHRLPSAIQAFIPQHQGTMQIAYFYHQAQQIAKSNPHIKVNEADFRYDGPIPQSRETAIVMLADSCEAALRSLKDTTSEKALAVVNNILRGRWQDNQLIDSGLTRAEMSLIAEIFVEVWQQFHHKRIAYPKFKPGN